MLPCAPPRGRHASSRPENGRITTLFVQVQPSLLACRLNQLGNLETWKILGPLEQPGAIIVDDKDGYHVRSVRTEGRPANKVHDDIAAPSLSNIACVIGQISHGIAGNAAGGKGEGSL